MHYLFQKVVSRLSTNHFTIVIAIAVEPVRTVVQEVVRERVLTVVLAHVKTIVRQDALVAC